MLEMAKVIPSTKFRHFSPNNQLEVSRKSENYPLVEEFFDKSSFCLRILGYLDGYALIYKELRWIMLSNDLQEILI